MKIIRCRASKGNLGYAVQQDDPSAVKLDGDFFNSPEVTAEKSK